MMIGVCFCLALIALVAGTFLLAKVQKDGLGMLYKIIAYKVIILSGLCIVLCIAAHFCHAGCCRGGMEGGCERREHCAPGGHEEQGMMGHEEGKMEETPVDSTMESK